jgi:hypothetical protein
MSTSDYAVLDLFCGLGGFSSAFAESGRWDVTTVDINGEFDPDITADVFDLRPSDFDREYDVVVASPPCTEFTVAAAWKENFDGGSPSTDEAADALALVHHAVGLIRGLAPDYWFMENPRGRLRTAYRRPQATVTYCQYGTEYQKPTDLWGEHPPMTYRRCRQGEDCHDRHKWNDPDGTEQRSKPRDPAERAKVPYELSEAIREACETALDGDTTGQSTLDLVA